MKVQKGSPAPKNVHRGHAANMNESPMQKGHVGNMPDSGACGPITSGSLQSIGGAMSAPNIPLGLGKGSSTKKPTGGF